MKKQKIPFKVNNFLTKKVIAVLISGILVLALVFALDHYNIINFFGHSDEPKGQAEGEKASADKKKILVEDGTSSNPPQKTDTPSTTYTTPSNPDNIVLTAKQNSDSAVTVMTKLIGFSDGTCILTITNGAKKYSQSANVIYQPEFSTCAGFNVPVYDLGPGVWIVDLKVVSREISQSNSITFEAK